MNKDAANFLAEGFLRGFFDILDAMLAKSFQFTVQPASVAGEAEIRGYLEEAPVQLQALIQQGLGQAVVLLPAQNVLQILAALAGTQPAEELGEPDKETLREIAEPALGGGVARVMELCGQGVVQLDGVKIELAGQPAAVTAAMGGKSIAAALEYSADGLQGKGFLLLSDGMDALVPAALPGAGTAAPSLAQPAISPDELSDILGGFPTHDVGGGEAAKRPAPILGATDNLDLVLDIRLLATARLGRVEMPLSDVLSLGPGSILEIGHLVDEPVELLINDKLIARGDVVVVDEKFGLRITEIVSTRDRIESLR